jgi:transketolase
MAVKGLDAMTPDDASGRGIHYGIREHGMSAAANGMAASGLLPTVGTFFVFSDYARPAVRLAAIMQTKVGFVWTHDSVGVGEDGPTHQPVEQLASLRAMPGLLVFRPADANEVVETWRIVAALKHEPAALVLSRQALPTLDRSVLGPASGVARGGYVLAEADGGAPAAILLATGSEVHLALAARDELQADGIPTRVVSLPCWELFDRQPEAYRDEVIPRDVTARVAIEEGSTLGWDRYVGDGGAVIGMRTFGASAPLKQLLRKFGFTPERVVEVARERVAAARNR